MLRGRGPRDLKEVIYPTPPVTAGRIMRYVRCERLSLFLPTRMWARRGALALAGPRRWLSARRLLAPPQTAPAAVPPGSAPSTHPGAATTCSTSSSEMSGSSSSTAAHRFTSRSTVAVSSTVGLHCLRPRLGTIRGRLGSSSSLPYLRQDGVRTAARCAATPPAIGQRRSVCTCSLNRTHGEGPLPLWRPAGFPAPPRQRRRGGSADRE